MPNHYAIRPLVRRIFTLVLTGRIGVKRRVGLHPARLPIIGAALILAASSAAVFADLTPYYSVTLSGTTGVVTRVSDNATVYSSTNHQAAIQYAIDNLPAGRTSRARVSLTGDFVANKTILIPSYTSIQLNGSITLASNVNANLIGQKNPTTGDTQIEMIGGTYDGNKYNQYYDPSGATSPGFYLFIFKKVTDSDFRGFIAQNCGSDAFVLDTNCRSNRSSNLVGRNAGIPETGYDNGNGLGDRGDHNTWTDCLAADTYSDGWVIKCQNSTFTRCVARGGATGGGFGFFCDRLIAYNNFFDCEVSGWDGRSVSLRKPTDPSKGDDPIVGNYMEFYIHNSGVVGSSDTSQAGGHLWSSRSAVNGLELIRSNHVQLLLVSNYLHGFRIRGANVSDTTGTVVAFGNTIDGQVEGHNNTLTFLAPNTNSVSIVKAGVSNNITIRNITPADATNSWAVRKYYELFSGLPALNVVVTNNQLIISWTAANYTLQSNTSLTNSSAWNAVPGGSSSPVMVNIDKNVEFFRLVKP